MKQGGTSYWDPVPALLLTKIHYYSRVTQHNKHEYAAVIMQQIFRGTLLIYGPGSCRISQLQPRGMGTVSTAGREVHRRLPNRALQQP